MTSAVDQRWADFAGALFDILVGLPEEGNVILGGTGTRYVQFMLRDSELLAEVSCNEFLDEEFRMSEDDERTLTGAGWTAPTGDYVVVNWLRVLSWPAEPSEYAEVVAESVAALRGALRIAEPSELTVRAWINGSEDTVDVAGLGLEIVTR